MIRENLEKIRKSIGKNIEILAATKSRSTEEVEKAIDAGIKIIGENRSEGLVQRHHELKDLDVKIHFIGHLQRNKVKDVVLIADMIQSLDSVKLAKKIDKEAAKIGKTQDVLIQINIGKEEQKYGILLEEVDEFVKKLKRMKNIKIKGFMCIAPYFTDPEKTRPYFRKMKGIFDKYNFEILSIGMTNDYKIAVEEGSTMVRIGTGVFGPR